MRRNLLLALGLTACAPGAAVPPRIAVGEVACDYCHMTVESERHAAQLVPVRGRGRVFDEPGCLLRYASTMPLGAGDRLWVMEETSGAWMDARRAFYVLPGQPRPGMMYGVLAYATASAAEGARGTGRVLTFDAALAALRS